MDKFIVSLQMDKLILSQRMNKWFQQVTEEQNPIKVLLKVIIRVLLEVIGDHPEPSREHIYIIELHRLHLIHIHYTTTN